MAIAGADMGNLACAGRGEKGLTGLGNSIGDDVGESDGNGEGNEYTELASDWMCPSTDESWSCRFGEPKGNAA